MDLIKIIISLLLTLGLYNNAIADTCPSASTYGVIPDGTDKRAQAQLALDAGCLNLDVPGNYIITVPPLPRTRQVLTMPMGARITGVPGAVLKFNGPTNSYDWRGIQLAAGVTIENITLDASALIMTTPNDQSPVMRMDGDGSFAPVYIHHIAIDTPVTGGDCIQFVGYDGTMPDRRIWNITIKDILFKRCSRSGIAVHSGVHNYAFLDSTYLDTWDQDIDGESGGNHGISDGVISGNTFIRGPSAQSGISLSPQDWFSAHIHNNTFERNVEIFGCNVCEFDHNIISNQNKEGIPLHIMKNASNIYIHDNVITHPNLGPAAVIKIEQIGSVAPDNITIENCTLNQEANSTTIASIGTQSLYVRYTTGNYKGTVPKIMLDAQPSFGTYAVQTSDITIEHSTFTGSYQAILHLNGASKGVGNFELNHVTAPGAVKSVWCENTLGIVGPAIYYDNALPNFVCGNLVAQ